MVFYRQTERNSIITPKHFVNTSNKYTQHVLIQMLTATRSLYLDIDGY